MYIDTKFIERLRQASCCFVFLLLACLAGGVAPAQTLSFTPGMVSGVASTNTTGSSDPEYTGPVSGLVLNQAQGLTFDSQGDLFIVDGGANVVRVVASGKGPIPSLPSVKSPVAGTVYTVAGSGSSTPSGSPLCGKADEMSSYDSNFYGNGCPATEAVLYLDAYAAYYGGRSRQTSGPDGQVALDANGNLYIPDGGDHQVRVVYAGGTVPGLQASLPADVTPIAGNIYAFTSAFDGAVDANQNSGNSNPDGSFDPQPIGVAVDASGDVYILSYGSYGYWPNLDLVYNGGTLPPLLTGQTLTAGQYTGITFSNFSSGPPWLAAAGIALDSFGNIYISDSYAGVDVIYAGGTVPGLSASLQGQTPVVGNIYQFLADSNFQTATQVNNNNPTQLSFDSAGDFYVGLYHSFWGPGFMAKVDTSGNVTLFAGNLNQDDNTGIQAVCAAAVDGYGDGCPANQVAITGPLGVTAASDGSIYYADFYQGSDPNTALYALHKIDVSASGLQFATQSAGVASSAQTVTVSNVDTKTLNISAINIPNNFIQVASGGTDCAAPITLTTGQSCQVAVEFQAVQAGTYSDSITITSDSNNAASGQNLIAVSGTATATTGTTAQTISFTAPSTATYGQTITLNGSATSKLPVIYQVSGPASINGSTLTVTGTGTITVTAYQPGDNGDSNNSAGWAAATPVPATINAQPALLTVTANNISQARTLPIPALTYTITTTINGVTSTAPASATTGAPTLTTTATQTSAPGNYPITITQNTLSTTSNNYSLIAASFVPGTFTIQSGSPQTITFTQTLPTVTYGVAPIDLTSAATATSGLTVVYSVTGPATTSGNNGTTLTVTGAGTVTITANQAGNSSYASASATESFQVNPATLTLTANNLTMAQGSTPPTLTYTVGGLVNGDSAAAVVSGTPTLATTATSSSPLGTYPITVAQGSVTLLSKNYALTSASYVNGTLTVVLGTPQTISFGALPNVTYGAAQRVLSATASSSLPVTFSVTSGPGTITGGVLSVNGSGTVTVTANQSGNTTYSPAPPVSQSFSVAQATLSIAANNLTIQNDIAIPALSFTVTGLVNGDTPSVLSNSPAMSTTATAGSSPGTYPINIASVDSFGNAVTAANYIINSYVPGTLTIISGGPAQDFTTSLSTPTLTILDGQTGQATLTVNPLYYYGGTLNLSCTGLPANASCVFSPSPLNVSIKQTATLTISTSNSATVGSLSRPANGIYSAAIAGWTSLLFGLVLVWQRKRFARYKGVWSIAIATVLLGVAGCLTACGGKSSSSSTGNGNAARGTSTIQIVATDANGGPTHNIPLIITIK